MEKQGLSIIVPVYNELDIIEKTIQQLQKMIERADFAIELIIVNDGSQDGTESILKSISQEGIRVIHHQRNYGYGFSIKSAIWSARFPFIGITDADGTYPNDRFLEFYQEMQDGEIDMIVGARTGKNAKIPWVRKPAKWMLNQLANYLTNEKIPDLNSGFRIFKVNVFNRFVKIIPDGFSLTSTITLAMLTNKFSVRYIPIDYYRREGKSKIRPIYDTLNFLQLIIRTTLYFNPLKVFVPLSSILFFCSLVVLFGSWLFTEKIMDVTSGIFVMTAVMVLVIGMLADLIETRLR
jgi:glycosyltransferase involved in cell wall biosynthesis